MSESSGRGEWSPVWYRFKVNAGSQATQQKSQGTPSLGATHGVPADLCGVAGSQGVDRVRPAEFIRLRNIKIWPCKRRALHCSGMQGKNGTTHLCLRFCQEPIFIRAEPLRVGMVGLDLWWGEAPVRFVGKWGECAPPQSHTSHWHPLCPELYILSQAADDSAWHEFCRMGWEVVQRVRLLLFPRLILRRGVPHPRKMASLVWERDSTSFLFLNRIYHNLCIH